MTNDEGITDVFGLAPYGKALNTLVAGGVDGAGAFWAAYVYLLLRNSVCCWGTRSVAGGQKMLLILPLRLKPCLNNSRCLSISCASSDRDKSYGGGVLGGYRRGSKYVAGLLISSCGPDGKDETNLIFTNILAQLTHTEASILKYSCEKSQRE